MISDSIPQKTLEIALDALEDMEFPSLVWGFVDSYVEEEQLLESIEAVFQKFGVLDDPEDALEKLEDGHLVRYWLNGDTRCYRSRFAELVRLIVRSKQLFDGTPWRSAPTLVSDYRVDISPRRYPKRDIDLKAVIADFKSFGLALTQIQLQTYELVLAVGGMNSLSRFQVDAFKRIFSAAPNLGTIITAGTGSGKTLAFYLPALMVVLEKLKEGAPFTKVLSIYPRNELLKDQLTEVYKLVRSTTSALSKDGRPKFSVGALYGQVPLYAGEQAVKDFSAWTYKKGGYLCPFLRCPDCGAETVWKSEDLDAKIERLHCTECSFLSDPAELRLTRNSISKSPPDFLFSTTEMLNQRMSDTDMQKVFGIGCRNDQRPSFILLDEVHTYVGTSGAQTALLLRRWKKMLGSGVHWVGLSATLEEADQFFSDLTGLFESSIQEITPNPLDMEEEGADYQILVRSDPSSQTATLSTSIQALMLLARMLDPKNDTPSCGLFGSRVFAFTDDLDVINRLFDNFKDAEAYTPWGKEDQSREPLARLRAQDRPEPDERDKDGQLWSVAEDLRGNLSDRLTVGRTTSRDPGVLNGADVIVATASLEVGFNDPNVGAVLQHKAPRSNASFVQRKGRAGRKRGMRPITLTVLSDYGRDRLAFQAYEEMFSPQIERQRLPVENGHILRMQATCALFDWISSIAVQGHVQGWSWNELSQPSHPKTNKKFVDVAKTVIVDLVRLDPSRISAFRKHLKQSLQIKDRAVDFILWEQPRSLLLETLPTLARRIFSDWKMEGNPSKHDFYIPYHPLPDFMPRQLFGELNLPEVTIYVPPSSQNGEEREERLRIRQALTEFSPGKVRRRFADDAGHVAHWFPLDPDQDRQVINVHDFAERKEYLGSFAINSMNEARTFRPWAIRVAQIVTRQRISHTSTSHWLWHSKFEFEGEPSSVELSIYAPWQKFVPNLEFYLHRLAGAITVRRYAHEGIASLNVRGETRRIEFRLTDAEVDAPAAVGFAYESDGIRIPLELPTAAHFSGLELPEAVKRWLKYLWFRSQVQTDDALPKTLNVFRRDWLLQIILHAAIRLSDQKAITFKEALREISFYDDAFELRSAIAATVSHEIIDEPEETLDRKLEQTLEKDLEEPGVLRRLCQIAIEVFWPDRDEHGEWLRYVFAHTIAEAVLQACVLSTPKNTAIDGLVNDLVREGDSFSILIVESTLGGGGTIEALSQKFAEDPRSFHKAMEAALAPSDSENAANSLLQILAEITQEGGCKTALGDLRRAKTSKSREHARIIFSKELSAKGIQYSRAVGVGFSTRFVKMGATEFTDQISMKLINFWEKLENEYDLGLPVRLVASLTSMDISIRNDLSSVGGVGQEVTTAERLMWPREGELRQFSLQSYNTYRDAWISDAGLVRALISEDPIKEIMFGEQSWEYQLGKELATNGIAALIGGASMSALVKGATEFIGYPIAVGYHQFYPVIDAYRENTKGTPEIIIAIREKV
jgi:hypothetical protein